MWRNIRWDEVEEWWWFIGLHDSYRTVGFRTKAGRTFIIPSILCGTLKCRDMLSERFEAHCGRRSETRSRTDGVPF
jgi:hypothetical protein